MVKQVQCLLELRWPSQHVPVLSSTSRPGISPQDFISASAESMPRVSISSGVREGGMNLESWFAKPYKVGLP